tara:strand:- start:922 stop:1344 length:423 start_codon:yes stop_codon:yes gene_type:complete
MFEAYQSTFMGLWLIVATIIIQAMVAVRIHRRQEGGYLPGVLKPSLDHTSIVFRTHRTLQNSLENLIPLLGLVVIALMSGYDANKLSIVIWIYAISRIVHMILYYKIATNKNPSPRSIFWATGFLTTLYLMIDLGVFLII